MSRQESDKFIEEARLLLPWYLTDTLSDEEQELVNKALEASPELRKEFVREEKMMRLVKENTSLLELSALDTTEQRLENTLARIEREELQQTQSEQEISPGHNTVSKQQSMSGWLERLFGLKLFDTSWLTPANAVFASLLALQVGVLGYYQFNKEEMVYHSVTTEQSSFAGDDSTESLKQRFLMEFSEKAQYGEVCDFLNHWNAQIVSGPNSRNVFVVEMKTRPHTDALALADTIMSQAEKNGAPVVFVGPKANFQD